MPPSSVDFETHLTVAKPVQPNPWPIIWGPRGLQVVLRLSSAQHVAPEKSPNCHVGLLEGNYLSKVLGVNFSETSVKAL